MRRLVPLWLSVVAVVIVALLVTELMTQRPYPVPFRGLPAEQAAFVEAMQPILRTAFPDGSEKASLDAKLAEWGYEPGDGGTAAHYLLHRSGCTIWIGITWQAQGERTVQDVSGTREETCF